MSHTNISLPLKRRRSVLRRNVLPGALVAVAILGALEVGFRVIAEGHTNPNVRLYALAFSVTAGALVGGLRGAGPLALLLVVGLGASSAQAGDRNRQYNVTVASSACPTGTPGLLYDFKPPGIALAGLRSYNVTVCPESGQTFTGTGAWKACVYKEAPGPMKWTLAPLFYLDMTDDGQGNPITSTLANPCVTFWDFEVGVNDGDLVYVYPTTTMGISGGTVVSVYLEGMLQ